MRTIHKSTAVIFLLLTSVGSAFAASPSVYEPAGAPANPKVAASWNRYHDYAEATKLLEQLAAAYPDRCKLQSLGKSYGDREMWVLTITNFKQGKIEDKAAFWIDGGIHANEIQATEVVLYTAWYLLESYEQSPFVAGLVNDRVFYLMPMMSPDSRDAHMYKPNSTHSPRSGQRPVDDDRDGLVDEDGPDDLDGDGSITQMRIRDPHGRWKAHPDYPGLMIPAKADEKGEYTLIDSEGIDNDGDGKVDEDSNGYYDPNRNFPWNWQPEYIQAGAHQYPLSILEDRMVADFINSKPQIAGAQSYHNAGGMILRGPSTKNDHYEPADTKLLKEIAERGEQMLPGYRSLEVAAELYELYGGEIDWLYNMQGVVAFTNELFTSFNFFREKEAGGYFGKPELAERFNKLLLLGDGVVKWHEVDHPQFGKIEVGGTRKNWLRQPPSFLLEEECHRNMAFSLYHADQIPRVAVSEVSVKPLGNELFQVSATISNDRMIPTRIASNQKNKLTPPDRVTISAEGLQILAGFTANDRLFDKPQEQRRDADVLELDQIPGMGARYVRWVVRGKGPYTVTVRSVKGGVAAASN